MVSLSGGESPSVFIGRQRDGRRLPRMLTKESSSSSFSPPPPGSFSCRLIPSPPLLLFSLPRTTLKYSRFALLALVWQQLQPNPLRLCLPREKEKEEDTARVHRRTGTQASRGQLVLSVRPRFSLSLAPLASTINIPVRGSCTATPSADHVTDICKVSIIRETAPTEPPGRAFLRRADIFLAFGSA